MRILGIDFGEKRVGLAVGNAQGGAPQPLKVIERTTRDKLFDELLAVIEAEGADVVVIGLPVNPMWTDPAPPLIERQIQNFAQRLARRVNLPIHLVDETFSSAEAESRLREAGRSGPALKKRLDAVAAAVIIESFLENGSLGRVDSDAKPQDPASFDSSHADSGIAPDISPQGADNGPEDN